MKRKILSFVGIFIGVIVALGALLYYLAAVLYTDTFSYNTYINGVYCTGKTPAEVNAKLISLYEKKNIEIISEYGSEYIEPKDFDYTVDYSQDLSFVFGQKSGWSWIKGLLEPKREYTVEPIISYSEEKLWEQLYSTKLYKAYMIVPDSKVSIVSKNGDFNLEEKLYKHLDMDALFELCDKAVFSNEVVDAVNSDVFIEPEYDSQMLATKELWSKLSDFLSMKIVYDMGDEKIELSRTDLSIFIDKSFTMEASSAEDEQIKIDKSAVDSYVDALCDKYDTFDLPRTYTTFDGQIKTFEGNNHYGTLISREAEKEFLYNALIEGADVEHVPTYKVTPYHRGLNDIGPEYIEVDLTKQTLIYVKDGEILLSSDVVTGKPSQGTPTPEMVCYVYKKSEDTYLKGTDYYNHVDYWMAIYKKIGLHDASWQRSFGGTRYIKHGSHGCINMPKKKAEDLYGLITVGVPVIVFK